MFKLKLVTLMENDKKGDFKFQIELLKIQLDVEYKLSWFFAIFAILISVVIAVPLEALRAGVVGLLVGSTLIFLAIQGDWKKKTLSELEQKYLS